MNAANAPGNDFDVVVVGSGIGGLVAGALLARLERRRVLVLERHYRAGGFTHTFDRPGGFSWDVGVHYVGTEVVTEGTTCDLFRVAGGGALEWNPLPETFERLHFPGFEFEMRAGRENLLEDLSRAFPAEAANVRAWLDDVDGAMSLLPLRVLRDALPAAARWVVDAVAARRSARADMPTGAYLARRFQDPRLRAIAGARWVDHGLPPAQSAFLAHGVITRHYLDGAVYPVGSAASLLEAMQRTIEAAGGEIRVRADVERILVERGRAIGVRLRGGEEILAPAIVSDAGARNTYLKLLPEDVPVPFRRELAAVPPGAAFATLYLGLSASAATLGARGENIWFHRGLDHDADWADRARLVDGVVTQGFVSFPSIKDPRAPAHTAEIVVPADPASFAQWEGTRWMKRGAAYQAMKERIADALLATAEERLPGLTGLVVHRELSTPLSTTHFTAHPAGESYGVPALAGALRQPWRTARTPIRGLHLAGADALFLGVVGAGMGGLAAALRVAGPSLMRRLGQESKRIAAGVPARGAAGPSSAAAR
ncbi:MAG TPA: NAD(P)/FAD-dependent oxidoreductase [Anaeromyxobacter sp.]|nr:NAD(P)/FAD-dependent oxidoreductase [Anaeromyxobacter sp.]